MELKWTQKALCDLARLYDYLSIENKQAAIQTVQALTRTTHILLTSPLIGEQLFEFKPHEVRRLLVGRYGIRYEIQNTVIYVLRLLSRS